MGKFRDNILARRLDKWTILSKFKKEWRIKMTNYIDIKGVITGDAAQYKKLKVFLDENNLTFEGIVGDVTDKEMVETVEFLVDNLLADDVEKGYTKAREIYACVSSDEDLLDTLTNTGTQNYYSIVKALLGDEQYLIFRRYSDANCVISDIFEGYFYNAMRSKLNTIQ